MRSLLDDLRFALRLWRKRFLTTTAAIACLALGIGATTMMFSLVDHLLLRPLPFEDADELVTVWTRFTGQGIDRAPVSGPEFIDLRDQTRSFEQIVGFIPWSLNLTGVDDPERLTAARVSSELFRMLGARPLAGRIFAPDEETREEKVVVISQALYERRLGGDAGRIGSSLSFDSVPYTVIGVMPADFRFLNDTTQVWMPLEINPRIRRDQRGVTVVARLADGTSVVQAQAEASGLASRLASEYGNFYVTGSGFDLAVVPLQEVMVGNVRPLLLTLLAAVVLVLLIGCSNVANLLLTQATTREREISLRAAIGAGRGRLVRQLLTESVFLAVVGGALGIALAFVGTRAAVRVGLGGLPRLSEVAIDGRILLFALGISVVTGLVFGMVPALKVSHRRLAEVLKDESRASAGGTSGVLRNVLVVGQIALALIVLVGAGLLIRSYQQIKGVDAGFRTDDIVTAQLILPLQRYSQRPLRIAYVDRLLGALERHPAIESVGAVSLLPFSGGVQLGDVAVVGRSDEENQGQPQVGWRMATPDYFSTLGIALQQGRGFSHLDHADSTPVVIVDRTMAERLWPDQSPLGQRIQLVGAFGGDAERTIVGVVSSINELTLESTTELLYIPYEQRPTPTVGVAMKVRGAPDAAFDAMRSAAVAADPDLPVASMAPMASMVDASLDRRKVNRLMFVLFGGASLLLTAIGVYSVMAYTVAQRRREIGLRGALGATPDSLRTLILGQSLRLAAIGIVGGVVAAMVVTRIFAQTLDSLTFGIGLTDALTYVAVPLFLAALALIASYVPAWSASRIDPVIALRQD